MEILMIDADPQTHDELTRCIREILPDAGLTAYADPLLALKHGAGHPVDLLIFQPRLRLPIAAAITRNLRAHHPEMRVVYIENAERRTESTETPDAAIHPPVTAETLRQTLRGLLVMEA
jgi:DNA-binding NarL/FixJ family response regulator